MQIFSAQFKQFLCRYLGLPLHKKKLRKIDYLPLLDMVVGRLPNWKGKQIAKPGRVQLVKSVLTSIVIYFAMVIPLLKWAVKQIETTMQNFIWKGDDA